MRKDMSNKELEDFSYKIWNEKARKQIENELNFMSKEKIELPKDQDYLEICSATHKTSEEIIEEKDKEIDRLNNIINEFEKWIRDNRATGLAQNHNLTVIFADMLLDKLKELKEE